MNFNNQINYIIERCYSRLNCIKILSQKNFKLTKDTLVQIYIALVRSVMEYSSIIISRLSNKNYKRLQAIQNSALRAIFKIPYKTCSNEIRTISGVKVLSERFSDLNKNYFINSFINNNPLISSLYEEYLLFSEARYLKYKSLFCEHKDILNTYYSLVWTIYSNYSKYN